RLEVLQLGDAHTDVPIGFGQFDEVGQRLHVGMRVAAVVLHVLPLAHHAQRAVVEVDDLHRQVVLQAGGQLLDVHLDTAFTGDTGHIHIREVQLGAHGGRQTEAHGA